MSKPRILLQLDSDPQPSVFDSVVAVDAGVEHLLRHGQVTPDAVRDLVHGAIFTRGPADLKNTAIFIGGSDVALGEALGEAARRAFFGPMRVSVLVDPSGANTTAAAAVLSAAEHVDLAGTSCFVLGGTGPVGQRVVRLLATQQAVVQVASRDRDRAARVCDAVRERLPQARLTPVAWDATSTTSDRLAGVQVLIAAGAAGIELLSEAERQQAASLCAAIDLNAVPPVGLAGIDPQDRGQVRNGVVCYGAIGVGGTKMKIHRAALRRLYERNDAFLDAEAVLAIGQELARAARTG